MSFMETLLEKAAAIPTSRGLDVFMMRLNETVEGLRIEFPDAMEEAEASATALADTAFAMFKQRDGVHVPEPEPTPVESAPSDPAPPAEPPAADPAPPIDALAPGLVEEPTAPPPSPETPAPVAEEPVSTEPTAPPAPTEEAPAASEQAPAVEDPAPPAETPAAESSLEAPAPTGKPGKKSKLSIGE